MSDLCDVVRHGLPLDASIAGYLTVIPGLLLGLLLIILPGLQGFATVLVTVAMALVIAPTVFASFYVGYRDIFGISEIV